MEADAFKKFVVIKLITSKILPSNKNNHISKTLNVIDKSCCQKFVSTKLD